MASRGPQGGGCGGLAFVVVGILILAAGVGGYYIAKNGLPVGLPNLGGPQINAWKDKEVLKVPYLFWGGDVASFHANGGIKTKSGSIFDKQGLKLEFTDGNDFEKQVTDYLAGETPFIRGTFSQLGQKCDVLGKDPRTRPVVILQLTWSQGDHLVSREGLKTLSDLKGKTVALQKG